MAGVSVPAQISLWSAVPLPAHARWTPSLVTATGTNTENVRGKQKEGALRDLCGSWSIFQVMKNRRYPPYPVVRSSGVLTTLSLGAACPGASPV